MTKKDFTQTAFDIFQQAIGEAEKPMSLTGRKANSSKGGKTGGAKRAENMTKEALSEQAKKAAGARWSNQKNRQAKNEGLTEQIVYKELNNLGYYNDSDTSVLVEPKKSIKPQIQKLLSTASKKVGGTGSGYPDYIIRDTEHENIAVVIECKADTSRHISDGLDQFKDYAVDGARLYADYLSKELDVIYVGVSGQSEKELKISHYVKLRGEKEHKEILKGCGLQEFPTYLEQLKNQRFRVDYSSLLEYVGGLNKQLHGKRIPEKQRAILFSGILLGLEDNSFRRSYKTFDNSADLMDLLIIQVSKKLNSASSKSLDKFAGLRDEFATIQHSPALIRDGYFKELVKEVEEKVYSFVKNNEYHDIVSRCYVEFLKYANDDGSLGIVLTPPHITQLFCDLAGVGKDTVVLDNCCGTAGFLVAAMGKMIAAAQGDKKKIEHIQKYQLVGVEYQPHIFNLAVSNMIIHGDGKSNIFHEDCFKSTNIVKPFKPTVALLNPPFNDGSGIDELEFIEQALSCLEANGVAIAIVPMSCAMYDSGNGLEIKRRLLKRHSLEASMSLPNQLFNDKGANTCALVFRAHIPHDPKKKTWFGYWRDDGFVKSKRRREDTAERWSSIREKWVDTFLNKTIETGYSLLKSVTAEDEWLCEAYLETDYSTITQQDFERDVKKFVLYNLMLDIQGGESDE
ncbi:MAG: bcgIA [Burkholderiaceae bacterium]|nr:bcgIA [Burkholderiaceae bacterium]